MKVVIVTDYTYVNGGAGKVALESAIPLASHVDHVYVFSAVGEVPETLKGHDRISVIPLGQKKVTDLAASQAMVKGLWNRPAEVAFRTLLSGLDPRDTVIHLHSWRDALTASPIAVAVKLGFKVVVTCHDFGLACPLAGFFDARHRTICHEKGLSFGCLTKSCTGGSFSKKSWFVARHAIQVGRGKLPASIKHFVFVSEFSHRILAPYLPAAARCHFVDNPISAEHLPKPDPTKSNTLVFVGRFSEEKGPEIAAAAAYKAGKPIKFVGIGPLADRIQESNPDAELLGWRNPIEVSQVLRSARALVFPSIWYETQGMVVNEAAANGIPVIVSDCTAAVGTVERLGHGLTFKSGSVDSLAERIKELDCDELVERLSTTGYNAFWSSAHSTDNHVKQLLEVYSEVLAD
jgi:glycosyltransferase involved in cell wall biosynthesis